MSKNGFIRIIAGKWRGRKLPVLDSEGLRPTTDRIKETLFNWLMPIIDESCCLDCFSGSGSLGFEALSRGANKVVLLEKNAKAAQQLNKNRQLLSAETCQVIATDSLNYLQQNALAQFDVVFIDPPFHQNLVNKTIERLEQNNWLKAKSYIYIETEPNYQLTLLPNSWRLHREKITGQIHSRLYIRETN